MMIERCEIFTKKINALNLSTQYMICPCLTLAGWQSSEVVLILDQFRHRPGMFVVETAAGTGGVSGPYCEARTP